MPVLPFRSAFAWACLLGISACAVPGGTGGSFEVPTEDLLGERYAANAPLSVASNPSPWWQTLGDPTLVSMVEIMLAQNPSLESAAQTVLAAEAQARSVGGSRGPSLDLGFDVNRSFFIPVPGGERVYTTSLSPSATLAWQTDLFGRLRSLERSAWSQAFASVADRDALAHSLIATLARQRVAHAVLARRLELAEGIVRSRAETLNIVTGRYERGVAGTDAVSVHQAKENLAAARAVVPDLHLQTKQTEHFLQELMGQKPGAALTTAELEVLPTLAQPPRDVPAALLDRRPDLRAANFRVQAQAANVDVALAALYPDLRLSATGGWESMEFSDLFDDDSLFWRLLGDLSVRLFGSGQLEADVDAARAQLRSSAADYRARVLTACREVEDALVAEARLREQWDTRQEQVREARLAEGLARDRYARGVGPLLTVLDTERRRANAEESVLLLEQLLWNTRIDLHLSLGGDWFPTDTESSQNTR